MPAEPDHILGDWRQGDYTLTPIDVPLLVTEDEEATVVFTAPTPVVILSQSCDIIRSATLRPYVQIAVLSPATPEEMAAIKAGTRVRYGYLPALEAHGLVVDFDVCATIDKETVRGWARQEGCANDNERRAFSAALARHRQRFAFPDDFNNIVKPLRKWVESKRSSDSVNGRLVRAVTEIRVVCNSWDAPQSLLFWLIIDEEIPADEREDWEKAAEAVKAKMKSKTDASMQISIMRYDDLSARDYLSSDRLDLDGLSDA